MFPIGHLAVGYLAFTGYRFYKGVTALPAVGMLLALAVGTQFPDLIDKPFSHLGLLLSGRSLGHSLIILLSISGVVWWVTERRQKHTYGVAFIIGAFSHLLADSYGPLLRRDWADLPHLFYPLTTPVVFESDGVSPLIRIVRYYTSPQWNVETAVTLLAAAVLVWQLWPLMQRDYTLLEK